MSIATELSALQGYIGDAYDAISGKSGTIPANKNMANLATAIASITTGGGFNPSGIGMTAASCGTVKNSSRIEHNLGVIPQIVIAYTDRGQITETDSTKRMIFAMKVQTGSLVTPSSSSSLMASGIGLTLLLYVQPDTDSTSINRCYATTTARNGNNYNIKGSSSGSGNTFYMATTTKIDYDAFVGSTQIFMSPTATYNWIALG